MDHLMAQRRREFVSNVVSALGASALISHTSLAAPQPPLSPTQNPTIQEVIDAIVRAIPGAPIKDTVDTIKSGDPNRKVTGIVTTFMANCDVIGKASRLGANLIITHEPTFYNHRDEVDWLVDDPVYRYKRQLLETSGMVVWRFHDYWHRHRPDGIMTGIVRLLQWQENAVSGEENIFTVPATTLRELAVSLKSKFGTAWVRVVGEPTMVCRRVGLMPGAAGGRPQIQFLSRKDIDVLVCGEIAEWETSEYVRDAVSAGVRKGLIILGHVESEEVGMKWLVEWLQPRFPQLRITHVPAGSAFTHV